jgi:hypothetical protein
MITSNDLKILAIHLPAFHRIPENDMWWGEGFTEWDNVRSGKPLFKNHWQPMIPINSYYYDLSKEEDIKHQFILAKEYGVYGFIFYHYWFNSEKMLFERPIEKILANKKVEGHFCLCWANATWVTTWHGRNPETLLEQEYAGETEWEKHLQYFLPIFRDERYIKRNNKPFLYIYNACEIPNYDGMLDYWDRRLKEEGFSGLYCIEYISSKNRALNSEKSSAVMEFEPLYTTYFDISKANLCKRYLCKKLKQVDYQNYDKLWKYNLKRKRTYRGKPIQRGCFVGWDNSSRKGKNSMIVKGQTPQKFGYYLNCLVNSARQDLDDEFLVINAWNEWSEGAYLEPDEKNGFAYLEVIKNINK